MLCIDIAINIRLCQIYKSFYGLFICTVYLQCILNFDVGSNRTTLNNSNSILAIIVRIDVGVDVTNLVVAIFILKYGICIQSDNIQIQNLFFTYFRHYVSDTRTFTLIRVELPESE